LASFECRIDDEIGPIASAHVSVYQPADETQISEESSA